MPSDQAATRSPAKAGAPLNFGRPHFQKDQVVLGMDQHQNLIPLGDIREPVGAEPELCREDSLISRNGPASFALQNGPLRPLALGDPCDQRVQTRRSRNAYRDKSRNFTNLSQGLPHPQNSHDHQDHDRR